MSVFSDFLKGFGPAGFRWRGCRPELFATDEIGCDPLIQRTVDRMIADNFFHAAKQRGELLSYLQPLDLTEEDVTEKVAHLVRSNSYVRAAVEAWVEQENRTNW